METCKNLIGGEWVGSSDHASFETRSPAAPDEVLAVFPSATAADAAQAAAAAAEAFPAWRATPAPNRGAILFRAAELLTERLDDVARTLTREEGKTLAEATRRGRPRARHPALLRRRGLAPRAATCCRPTPPTACCSAGASRSASSPPSRRGTSPSPSPPGRSRRRSPTATPSSSSRLSARRSRRCAWSSACVDAGLPAGVLNFVTGSGAAVGAAFAGEPRGAGPHVHGVARHRRRGSTRARRSTSRACSWRWAARTRPSSSTTPTSGWPSGSPSWAASASPARAARPRAA